MASDVHFRANSPKATFLNDNLGNPSRTILRGKFTADAWYSLPIAIHETIAHTNKTIRSWTNTSVVPLEDLAYLQITHWDFYDSLVLGEMIVHKSMADSVLKVFEQLFRNKFPIHKMRLTHNYESEKHCIEADNTYGYFPGPIQGFHKETSHKNWLGKTVTINPVHNPFVFAKSIFPPTSKEFLDRSRSEPYVITKKGSVVAAFKKEGWEWGGDASFVIDYAQFSHQEVKKVEVKREEKEEEKSEVKIVEKKVDLKSKVKFPPIKKPHLSIKSNRK